MIYLPHRRKAFRSGFSPLDLNSLKGWWRAEDETIGSVASWADLSGNGNHLTQTTADSKPVNTANQLNGKAAVIFDGVDDYIDGMFSFGQPAEYWVVVNRLDLTDTGTIFDGRSGNTNTCYIGATSENVNLYAGKFANDAANPDLTTGSFDLLRVLFNSDTSEISVNGGTISIVNAGTRTAFGFALGGVWDDGNYTNIAVAEAFILTTATTTAEKTKLYTYLNSQYGWTL